MRILIEKINNREISWDDIEQEVLKIRREKKIKPKVEG